MPAMTPTRKQRNLRRLGYAFAAFGLGTFIYGIVLVGLVLGCLYGLSVALMLTGLAVAGHADDQANQERSSARVIGTVPRADNAVNTTNAA